MLHACLLTRPLRHPLRKTGRLARFPLFVVYLATLVVLPLSSATATHLPGVACFERPPAGSLPCVAAIKLTSHSSLL